MCQSTLKNIIAQEKGKGKHVVSLPPFYCTLLSESTLIFHFFHTALPEPPLIKNKKKSKETKTTPKKTKEKLTKQMLGHES